MKKITLLFTLILYTVLSFGQNVVFNTTTVSNILWHQATAAGEITSDGGNAITARGFVFAKTTAPTTADLVTNNDGGTVGTFSAFLPTLDSNTLYFTRAYATTSTGTSYSNEVSFTTLTEQVPSVNGPGYSLSRTLSLFGVVGSENGSSVTEFGFVYSLSPLPTLSDFVIIGTGSYFNFSANVVDLTPGTQYFIRAYAKNAIGTGYSSEFSITTFPTNPIGTLWNSASINVTKTNFADWTLAANQDQITSNVWLTRQNSKGIYNIKTETIFNKPSSPADTEWAYGTTANTVDPIFRTWADWHGEDPSGTIGQDAILHLITDNIYIDIKFTSWQDGSGNGGGFSYIRSTTTSTLGVDKIKKEFNFSLYPNPTRNFVNLNYANTVSVKKLQLFNSVGSLIKEFNNTQKELNIAHLPTGFYFLKVDSNKGIVNYKIIKE